MINIALYIILGYIVFKDLREMIISNKSLVCLFCLGIINLFIDTVSIEKILLSLAMNSFIFGSLYILGKNIIGAGDVKLAMVLSLWLVFPYNLLAWWIAFTIGGLVGIILILLCKRKLKAKVPFAPMIIIGTIISYLYGSDLWNWWQYIILK